MSSSTTSATALFNCSFETKTPSARSISPSIDTGACAFSLGLSPFCSATKICA